MRDQSHLSETERREHAKHDALARTMVEEFADKECWCVVADAIAMVSKMKSVIRAATGEDVDVGDMQIGGVASGPALTRAFDKAAGRQPKKPAPPVS